MERQEIGRYALDPVAPGLTGVPLLLVRAADSDGHGGWVYIMADRYRGTLDVGVTTHLASRVRFKRWRRDWKFALVERSNPAWTDLSELRS